MSGGAGVLVAGDGERRELPSFRPVPPASRIHARHIIPNAILQVIASQSDFAASLILRPGRHLPEDVTERGL